MHPPLSDNDIEAELSYAYVHAVAAQAGMACSVAARHADNRGVDAHISAWLPDAQPPHLAEVTINLQLKATIKPPILREGFYAYSLAGIDRYNALRCENLGTPRFLVVLFLPPNKKQWLEHSPERLSLLRCAWWTSLLGAPASDNTTAQTIYLPQGRTFSPTHLLNLAHQLSRAEPVRYEMPP